MAYSTQSVTSDGTLVLLSLSLDYFDRSEITVLYDGILNTTGWAWVGTTATQISFSPAVPNGVVVKVKRDTSVSAIRHAFSLGAAFIAANIDEDFKQTLRVVQEARENPTLTDIFNQLDIHGHKIINLAAGTNALDAVNFAQLTANNTIVQGYATAASNSASAASGSAAAAAGSVAAIAGYSTTASNAATAAAGSAVSADGSVTAAAAQVALASGYATQASTYRLQAINAQTGTTYSAVAADADKLVTCSNVAGITFTVPTDAAQNIAVGKSFDVLQLGAGVVTLVGDTGVTLVRATGLKTRTQYSVATALKIAANTWLIAGDTAP